MSNSPVESANELPKGSVPLAGSMVLENGQPEVKPVFQGTQPIEIELPDGRKVGMAPPQMSISMHLANILSEIDFKNLGVAELERNRVKSLLYITHVDGEQIPKIADPISRRALEQKLGDQYLDAIFMTWMDNFPPIDQAQFKVVKKSLPTMNG